MTTCYRHGKEEAMGEMVLTREDVVKWRKFFQAKTKVKPNDKLSLYFLDRLRKKKHLNGVSRLNLLDEIEDLIKEPRMTKEDRRTLKDKAMTWFEMVDPWTHGDFSLGYGYSGYRSRKDHCLFFLRLIQEYLSGAYEDWRLAYITIKPPHWPMPVVPPHLQSEIGKQTSRPGPEDIEKLADLSLRKMKSRFQWDWEKRAWMGQDGDQWVPTSKEVVEKFIKSVMVRYWGNHHKQDVSDVYFKVRYKLKRQVEVLSPREPWQSHEYMARLILKTMNNQYQWNTDEKVWMHIIDGDWVYINALHVERLVTDFARQMWGTFFERRDITSIYSRVKHMSDYLENNGSDIVMTPRQVEVSLSILRFTKEFKEGDTSVVRMCLHLNRPVVKQFGMTRKGLALIFAEIYHNHILPINHLGSACGKRLYDQAMKEFSWWMGFTNRRLIDERKEPEFTPRGVPKARAKINHAMAWPRILPKAETADPKADAKMLV